MRTPTCPSCDTASTRTQTRTDSYIKVADCLCANGHIWTVRWLRPINLVSKDPSD